MNIISINALVRVKLTDFGRKKLIEKAHKRYGAEPMWLNGNVWEAPLWEVMNMLGEYLHMGTPNEESIFADPDFEILQS